jgi:hypothetical protein
MKKVTRKALSTPAPAPLAGQSAQQVQVQVPLLYADAIGNVLMSPVTSRLTLVLNSGPAKDGVQPTVPTMEVVIPTPALLLFGKNFLHLIKDRAPEFAKTYEAAAKQVADLASELSKSA